jgi:AbrB family looped-hinge helix DNA binding protein
MIYTNSITSKGQITLPKAFRDKLGLDKASKANIKLNKRDEIIISRPPTADETLAKIQKVIANPSGNQELSEKAKLIGDYLADKYNVH